MPAVVLNRKADLLDTAKGILRFHFPTEKYTCPMNRKLCGGCIDVWGRMVLWPCYQADWALLIRRRADHEKHDQQSGDTPGALPN